MPGAGGRRAVWYSGFAVYAAGVALFSGPGLDHCWGAWAAGGYAIAALVTVVTSRQCRARAWGARLAVAASLAGALAAPALWLMTKEPTPPDVAVVARSGVLLLHHGTPYLPVAALSTGGWLAYNPYLPVMALFGLPGALGAARKDVALADRRDVPAAVRDVPGHARAARGRPAARRARARRVLAGLPGHGVPADDGDHRPAGDRPDLPVARAARQERARARRPRAATATSCSPPLVLGVACAMKYTAWPALAIIAVMVAARTGVRSAVRFTAMVLAAAAALVAALAPAALRHPASILQNTVAYPLGLTSAKSPAQSPLPGHLIATLGSGGHLAALMLLAAAGLATAASLVIWPPATPAAAARRIAIGLTALFLLSPATRFGYFIYPISLYAWAVLADREGTGGARRGTVDLALPDVVAARARGRFDGADPGDAELDGERAAELI